MRSLRASFLIALIWGAASLAIKPPIYTISVAMADNETSDGAGTINISENTYGRIVIMLFGNSGFSIQTPGSAQQPITYSPDGQTIFSDKISSIFDLYIKPKALDNGNIGLNGVVNIF